MKLGKLFRSVVEIATLPVAIAVDLVATPIDLGEGDDFMHRTKDKLKDIEETLDEVTDD